MDDIVITRITSADARYVAVWALREEILRKPLGMSLKDEDLSKDHIDHIFIAQHDNEVVGCLMLHKVADALQLRQMAIYNEWQGKGIGRLLVSGAEKFASEEKYSKIILHARAVAVGFYKSLGYNIEGDEFTEVGIPHFIMEKRLS